ncbi:MAG: hypothetical protein F4X76_12095 [Chloroflexi bacterium]|nr:hypothetical protein [Chloroflexota bacterium]
MEVLLAEVGDPTNTITIMTLSLAGAFGGALVAVLATEVLAARRRRRESRATLLGLFERTRSAAAFVGSARLGMARPHYIPSAVAILRDIQLGEHIVALENRLSADELDRLSKWLFFARTDLEAYQEIVAVLPGEATKEITSASDYVEAARVMLRISAGLAEPFGWLRHPRTRRRLLQDRRALIAKDRVWDEEIRRRVEGMNDD